MRNLLLSKRSATSPERDLWCGVLFQALKDASKLHELEAGYKRNNNSSKPFIYRLERDLIDARQAMRWLTKPSKDLLEVCDLAGINYDAVLERRERFLAGRFEDLEPLIATHEKLP